VHDAERVRLGERLARLQHELHRLPGRQRPLFLEPGGQIAPLEVLHHHVRLARLQRRHVRDAGDVLALDLHGSARLAQEALGGLRAPEGRHGHHLDGHPLVELQMTRRDDHTHAAHAQHVLDAELAGDHIAFAHERLR
jgi:hypothetical protein